MNNFNYTNSAKLLFLSFLFSFGFNSTLIGQTYNQVLNLKIANGNDDGEEFPGGGITLNSSDIEMVNDGASNLIAAFRFQLPLPSGASINSATLQFFAEEVQVGISNLTIQIENSGDSPALAANSGNFSSRNTTNTTINWSPPPWPNIGQSGLAEQSPDITALLNEILSHPAWNVGNAITFFIKGAGTRTTYAYDQSPTRAASLIIDADIPLPTNAIPQVYINEVVANASSFADQSGKFEDWIEIYNPNNVNVNLGGLFLTDKLSSLDKWQIPTGTIVPANGYLVFFADKDELEGPLHTSFSLKAGGEAVGLAQQLVGGLTIIDEITFDEMPFQASYGRVADGANTWTHFGQVTPGASNNSAELYVAPPNISLASGSYSGIQSTTLSHPDPSVAIYYTTDGSFPNNSSTFYTGGNIFVNSTQSIRAVAIKNGAVSSHPALGTYMVNENNNLPVIYLTTDPDNFFDNQNGIYVDGTNGVIAYCATVPVNWARDWERPTNIKMFLPNGSLAFDVNAGVKISGACSRSQAMKSLSISTRSKIYGDKNISYPLFEERTHSKYERIKLRNSGQDYQRLGFRDMINQSLHFGKVDLELQAGRPSILYLNGEFWGLYNIREKYAGEYFEAIYGLDEDDLDIIKSPKLPWQDIKKGNDIAYNALFDIVQNSNFTNNADFQYFESQVDVNEFTNYWIAMTYMANYDWPANNLTIWKERAPNTKWRYGVADNDGSSNNILSPAAAPEFNTFAAINDVNNTQILNHANSTLFLRKALDRQSFRNEFIQRTCSFIELIYTEERTNAATDEVVNLYRPNLGRHLTKWASNNAMGGSESSWDGWINFYKIFWQDRPTHMRQHINNFYGLSGNYQLTVNYDANTNGDVFVNSNKMAIPFNYTGTYFRNIPLRVTAVAKAGYIFSHWAETGETTPEIDFVANGNATLTPIFTLDVCDGSLNGLPCNDGNDCTINDVYDINCNCAGTVIDTDNDGVCDANDNCPNNSNANQSDIDNDGIGDVCDSCDGNLAGTTCDDGNPNTVNDVYDANCNCAGTVTGTCTNTENLALNKPATQSSVIFGATASRANDGNTDGNFLNNSVSATDSETNPWWTVDLGAVYNIEDIEIWNRTDNRADRLSNYYVFVSDNAFTSSNINTTIADANVTNFFFAAQAGSPTIATANTTGRYIRIQLNYTEHLTIAEIRVIGCGMSNCLPAGTACDDGNPNTTNDVEDGNCNCAGTPVGNGDLTLTCPDNITMTVPVGTASTPVSWAAPTLNSTCPTGGATMVQTAGPASGSNFPIGTATVSYSATDNCGNSQTCSFFVTIMEENTTGCTSTSNIALTGTATQSSVVFGAVASRANDGNTNGNFLNGSVAATGFDLNAWWEIDLGTIQNIESINLWNRTDNRSDRLSNYYLLISDVPFSSTNLNTSIAQSGVMNIQETGQASSPSAYTVGRTGRYVRIQLNYTENLTITEVEIMGCATNACPAAGTACDDNNPNTINDIEDGNCNCSGTTIGGGNYCDVQSDFPWQEWVSNVRIGSINNNSGKSTYGDYLSLSTNLTVGSNVPLSVSTSFSFINYPVFTRVWIDFNQNKVFEANELVLSADQTNVPAGTIVDILTTTIAVPQNAVLGITRMRVMLQKSNAPTACDNISFGEVEDYTINITATSSQQRAVLALEANKENRSAHLSWVTNTEFKNDYFVIERSDDMGSFEKIATINSNQELSNNLRTYHFTDETPMTGDNYYRIKQVFVDGNFKYTNDRLLIFGERFKLNLYPNPAGEYTLLDLQQYTGNAVQLTIFNNLGMPIKTIKIDEVNANPIHIDLSHFENGIYTVFIQTQGRRSQSRKLVVTRMY